MTNRQKFTEVFDCEIVRRDTGEPVPCHCKILIAESEHFDEWLQKEYEPSAQQGWIPVTERLPTENNSYLVWMPYTPEGHHITVAEWCGSYWNIKTPIMAWMPLPKPWEGAKDGKAD